MPGVGPDQACFTGAWTPAKGGDAEVVSPPSGTVLDRVNPDTPAYTEEVFGPVAPVVRFSSLDELANSTEYGLSLGVITTNSMRGLEIADRIPSGIVHINDQTVDDEAVVPFGGVGSSGTGSRFGGTRANLEAFTETQWITMQADPARYPF